MCSSPRSSSAPASSNVNPSDTVSWWSQQARPAPQALTPLQGPRQEGPLPAPPCSPGLGQRSAADRVPIFGKQEINYLAKLSSEPGARGATAEGESENTSTSSPPEEGGGPAGAGGTAPRPRRSADGEGVDWKTGKKRVSAEPLGTQRPAGQCHALPRRPLGCVVRTGRCRLWPLLGCNCPRLRPETITWCKRVPPHTTEVPHLFPESHLSENSSGNMSWKRSIAMCAQSSNPGHTARWRGAARVPRPPLCCCLREKVQQSHRTNL